MRSKGDFLKDRTMEQDNGFGLGIGSLAEVIDVTIGSQATDNGGTGWCLNGLSLGADGDLAVIADTNPRLLAPDKGPPGTSRNRPQDRAFARDGLGASGVRSGAQFAMDFVLVGVSQQLVQEVVSADQFADVIGGQEGRQAFLPVVVAAFDFAFGLGCGRVKQFDCVEVKRLAQLGESLGLMGVEEGVKVHIESQGQTVRLKGAGQEVAMGQERFTGIKACAGVVAGGVVQNIQQDLFVRLARQPSMGTGVILPKRAVVPGLPTFDGFGRGFVAGVGSQLVDDGPASDAGAVGLKIKAAMEFAGCGAVRRGWFGGKEFGQQSHNFFWPVGSVIATGNTGRPGGLFPLSTGAQVLAVEFVEAGPG